MLVVGGTYDERCDTPAWRITQGSGMRAAIALSTQGSHLVTAVDRVLGPDAELVANAVGLQRETVGRSDPVGFDYFTPLSTPRVTGARAEAAGVLRGESETALVFGMLERAQYEVRSKRLVFDPQRPGSGDRMGLAGLQADEIAIVLNAGETMAFGGGASIVQSVGHLFDQTGASVIVVKEGASGAHVFQREDQAAGGAGAGIAVGAFPTSRVWPIGSGDTFAAGFAHAWGAGADPVEAARTGSAAAAFWCGTQNPVLPDTILGGSESDWAERHGLALLAEPARDLVPRVYIAGPFFNLGERWLVDLVRKALLAQNMAVFSPFHDVGLGDESVAKADIEGLKTCTAVLALLDGGDFGTVFEAGWAEHASIPVVGYASRPDVEGAKMLTGLSGELHDDLSTAVYRSAWRALGAPPALKQGVQWNLSGADESSATSDSLGPPLAAGGAGEG